MTRRRLRKVIDRAAHFSVLLVAHGILASALLVTYEVVGRKYFADAAVLGSSLGWVEELSTYIVAWVVFIYIGLVAWRSGHVSAALLSEGLERSRFRPVLVVIRRAAAAFVGVTWIVFGLRLVQSDASVDARSISSLSAPYWVVHLCVPIGGAGLVLAVGVQSVLSLRRRWNARAGS